MKLTKDTPIAQAMETHPHAAAVFAQVGLGCVGCPLAAQETIGQGLAVHGMSDEEIDEIVDELNKMDEDENNN